MLGDAGDILRFLLQVMSLLKTHSVSRLFVDRTNQTRLLLKGGRTPQVGDAMLGGGALDPPLQPGFSKATSPLKVVFSVGGVTAPGVKAHTLAQNGC